MTPDSKAAMEKARNEAGEDCDKNRNPDVFSPHSFDVGWQLAAEFYEGKSAFNMSQKIRKNDVSERHVAEEYTTPPAQESPEVRELKYHLENLLSWLDSEPPERWSANFTGAQALAKNSLAAYDAKKGRG